MIRLAIISANLGSYDPPQPWIPQALPDGEVTERRLTDETFPIRKLAMTSRLQCGIPKMFGWEMFPGYDLYLWIDASCRLPTKDAAAKWERLLWDGHDIAVFAHPDRSSVREEYGFMIERMARPGEKYLTSRYAGEWLDEQYHAVASDRAYPDDCLYASTAFLYRPTERVKAALTEWWLHKSARCLHDQIAFPYVLWKHNCAVKVIEQDYRDCELLEYMRNK